MRTPWFLAFSLFALSSFAQSPRINVERPAHAYEVINDTPLEISAKADRTAVADFLDRKQQAKADFSKEVRRACGPLASGELTALEFAQTLDSAVEKMRGAMSAAYDQMSSSLSASGRSALQVAARRSNGVSADTVAVDIVATAPAEADLMFSVLCNNGTPSPAP